MLLFCKGGKGIGGKERVISESKAVRDGEMAYI